MFRILKKLFEQNEEYLDNNKNEEEPIIEKILKKKIENDISRLCVECKSILMEQKEEKSDYYINFE